MGIAAIAILRFTYTRQTEDGYREELSNSEEVLSVRKKCLADFKEEDNNPPINTDNIPGGYVYPFSFTVP